MPSLAFYYNSTVIKDFNHYLVKDKSAAPVPLFYPPNIAPVMNPKRPTDSNCDFKKVKRKNDILTSLYQFPTLLLINTES
jgi:hypothetical protein